MYTGSVEQHPGILNYTYILLTLLNRVESRVFRAYFSPFNQPFANSGLCSPERLYLARPYIRLYSIHKYQDGYFQEKFSKSIFYVTLAKQNVG